MQIDWQNITSLAYQTLLELDIQQFPIPVKKIKCKDVIISSLQKYSAITGYSLDTLTLNHELDDAFLLKDLRPGLSIILYNRDKYSPRMKHSLWHEIGHIKCRHTKHGDQEEIEANYFAAQATAPNVLIKEIVSRGYQLNVPLLVQCFGISTMAAQKKIDYINQHGFIHSNPYDNVVLLQFASYIDKAYPKMTQYAYNNYFDDLEEERLRW